MPVNSDRICVIINERAGVRSKKDIPNLLRAAFSDNILDVFFTKHKGHASELAKNAVAENYSYVIVCGGDGTVNEVAQELLFTPIVLGILPLGSGNGLARHLKIPMQIENALSVLKKQKSICIDTGKVNEKVFIGVAGFGFDAHIGKAFQGLKKRGFRSYVKLISQEYQSYNEQAFTIEIEGNAPQKKKAFLLTAANSSQFGNNAHIAPMASVQSKRLELCVLKKTPLLFTPWLAYLLFSKRVLNSKYFEYLSFTKATVTAKSKLCHLDGEPYEIGEKFKIEVVPQSLFVVVK